MNNGWKKGEVGSFQKVGRVELKELLGLTSCEVSINQLAAGTAVPFVHKHKLNEETYLVLAGSGEFWLDGEVIPLVEGSSVKVAPAVERCLRAGEKTALTYICVQGTTDSLTQYTRTDGVITESKTGW